MRALWMLVQLIFWVALLLGVVLLPYLVVWFGTFEWRPWEWNGWVRAIWLAVQVCWAAAVTSKVLED